jgi:hypothetical protein
MRVLSPAGLLSCLGMHSGGSEGRLAPDVPLGRVSALCRRGPRADQRRRLHQGAAGLGGGGADAHPGQVGRSGAPPPPPRACALLSRPPLCWAAKGAARLDHLAGNPSHTPPCHHARAQPGEEGCGHAGRFWQGRIRRHPAG